MALKSKKTIMCRYVNHSSEYANNSCTARRRRRRSSFRQCHQTYPRTRYLRSLNSNTDSKIYVLENEVKRMNEQMHRLQTELVPIFKQAREKVLSLPQV
jgi:hypothetical protein